MSHESDHAAGALGCQANDIHCSASSFIEFDNSLAASNLSQRVIRRALLQRQFGRLSTWRRLAGHLCLSCLWRRIWLCRWSQLFLTLLHESPDKISLDQVKKKQIKTVVFLMLLLMLQLVRGLLFRKVPRVSSSVSGLTNLTMDESSGGSNATACVSAIQKNEAIAA